MSSNFKNINFTVQQENVGSLLFLDVKVCRKNGLFVTSVYRKPTLSWIFTNYESFIPTYQKRELLHTLLLRSFSIYCDFKTFHFEIDHLKTKKTNYHLNLINYIRLKLRFWMHLKEMFLSRYPSWEVLRFKLRKTFKNYSVINWRPAISKSVLRHLLESKAFSPSRIRYLRCYFQELLTSIGVVAAMLPIMERSNAICEHLGISHLSRKKVKIDNSKLMAIQEHLL